MGKRKAARKPMPKRKMEKLETLFMYPFYSHLGCEAKLDKKKKLGYIQCSVCSEDFQSRIHSLSEPIDVYNDWIDACEEANKDGILDEIIPSKD
ncbi:transcription elongation factor 1 family protein [Staphylococcus aureus]